MYTSFYGNPCITIASCYSLTSDETDNIKYYNELSFFVRCFPQHSIGKDENDKFCLLNSLNKNGEYLADFPHENTLACLNTKFQKREGNIWPYNYPNNSKTQLNDIFINKQLLNSALNCEAYSSFEGVSSEHRIVLAKIRPSLRRNKT